ncbi:ABC transporter [Serratia fonticola]|uniref:ABC transporter n=1 Tax=Serratia fonticola TaxID=47917 RepID=UPI00192B9094|nr:ABC transporter [Serratia fonticola]MBL5859380.1 ABC transporter [Serratia fonticola]CAI1731330.1 Lauroyl/myristoyl acyltransferase [Serratia fonticola]CAI1825422.1 Lauroyl/myristoyl acyltransferase [Serratia fonticola]
MRFFAVWAYLAWRNSLATLTRSMAPLRKAQRSTACWLLQHGDYRWFLALAAWGRRLRLGDRGERRRAFVAAANKQCLLGDGRKLDFAGVSYRRRLLDLAATYGQSPQIQAQMERCKAQLNAVVEPLHQAGSPVVLAPLHMVSDVLAGMVGGAAFPGQATVIVSSSVEIYQEKVRQLGKVNLAYCSIHDDSREIAGNLMAAIMEAADHRRNIMIFPDITPDYTVNANTAATAKLPCRLFDRPANLHSGVIRIARALSAQVVFYYLYYDQELKIHIEPPVQARSLKARLPEIIETSIARHPEDWLLWHSHSLFFINE